MDHKKNHERSVAINCTQRVEFAHSLRGIAALSVLISHFLGVFWLSPGSVVSLLNVSDYTVPSVPYIIPLHFSNHFNYGSFGVAIFFLISGFVIPFSLKKLPAASFLMARIFRIYPVYIFSLCISVAFILLLNKIGYGKSFSYSVNHLVAQAALIRGWLWIPSVDGISWTLEIEIVFYAIAAIILPSIFRSNRGGRIIILYSIVVLLFCVCGLSILDNLKGALQTAVLYATYALPFTIYMFIGTLFYLASHRDITLAELVFGVIVAFWSFSIGLSAHSALRSLSTTSYFIALVLFALFWVVRDDFKSNKVLDWLADISYPLYAAHAIMGYSIMYILNDLKMPPFGIISVTFFAVLLFAWGIHSLIERPTMLYGKELGKKLFSK